MTYLQEEIDEQIPRNLTLILNYDTSRQLGERVQWSLVYRTLKAFVLNRRLSPSPEGNNLSNYFFVYPLGVDTTGADPPPPPSKRREGM